MARPRVLPPIGELIKMSEAGHSHSEIAGILSEKLGVPVARSTISAAFHRAGVSANAHRYSQELPWRVKSEHLSQYPARMLRLLGRKRAGLELGPGDEKRLERWMGLLEREREVVGYDPNTIEGFWYVPRRGSEGRDGIPIRRKTIDVNELRYGGVDEPKS